MVIKKKSIFFSLPAGSARHLIYSFHTLSYFIVVILSINACLLFLCALLHGKALHSQKYTRVGTLILAIIYLQLIQNRYMFRSFAVLQCSHQHCAQPVASDVEVVGYL